MLRVAIEKKLGDFHLNVDFSTSNGITGLLGASGCGKSVTLQCIAGLLKPDRGYIACDGQVLFDSEHHINLPPRQRKIGYLFQNYALFPHMTVAQNIASGILSRHGRQEAVARLMEQFYLQGLENLLPRQLSGGQQQRVALARILAGSPEILLLDEPFSALDGYLRWQVELELSDLLTQFGGPVLFVSHSRDEVYRLCRQVCVLERGRSEPIQPVQRLFDSPQTLSACLLSGCKNISRARKQSEMTLFASDWGVTLQTNRPIPDNLTHIGVRAHYLQPDGAVNAMECGVERVVEEVFSTVLMLTTPAGGREYGRLRMEVDKELGRRLAQRERLTVGIRPEDILLLTEVQRP